MVRIVLDTNILVSGLLYNGKPRKLLDLAVNGKMELVSSTELIDELGEVLAREKFGLSKDEQAVMVDFVIRLSKIIALKSKFKAVKEDPDDDIVINTAYDGDADYIVTGDRAILALKKFGKTSIVKASEMLNYF